MLQIEVLKAMHITLLRLELINCIALLLSQNDDYDSALVPLKLIFCNQSTGLRPGESKIFNTNISALATKTLAVL